ncbi:tail fiber protein [Chitinophaga sp. HK235]|uniref:tail fiber protein n=1 Tax=Chitinophaga sp. HK235 TaxID=2952571 RepID=UPI001BA5BA23|nr:tail fiber protein [Chitinophaga sp. HK235]
MKNVRLFASCIVLCWFFSLKSYAQTEVPWKFLGVTQEMSSPYNFYYYKIAEVKGLNDRYSSLIEVSVQGDPNYFEIPGTFLIRIEKWDNSPNRFDGAEIRCTSGSPAAATFYVFNNALWFKSNYKWGGIYYKAVHFGNDPLPGGTFGQTTAEPAGALTTTSNFGLKCDFDNNRFFKLPFTDVTGNTFNSEGLVLGAPVKQGMVAINATNKPGNDFVYITKDVTSANTDFYSNYKGLTDIQNGVFAYGVRPTTKSWDLFEKGYNADWTNLFHVNADGNIGIGTINPQSKLAVKGTIQATKVRVTTAADAWPDYVFSKNYVLPSLQEVENYISEHQHLPGMPSAAEVAQNGHDLGEVNQKLLQKVEELTLYIIDLQKRMQQLEQKK